MTQIDLRALPDSLSFASLPKTVRHSFLNSLRQVFLLVLLHPTRAGCLKCSFESPLYWFLLGNNDLAPAAPEAVIALTTASALLRYVAEVTAATALAASNPFC